MLAYLGGIVRKLQGKVIESNARPDHVHCLLSLPPTLAVAEVDSVAPPGLGSLGVGPGPHG